MAWRKPGDRRWWGRIRLADGSRPGAFAITEPGSEKWSEARARDYVLALQQRAHAEGRTRKPRVIADPAATATTPAAGAPTIATMLDRWLEEVIEPSELAPATKAGHRTNVARVRAAFGDKTPADLTIPVLRAWLRVVREELSATRTHNVFNSLGRFVDDAAAEGWHDAVNHCRNRAVRAELPSVGERDDEDKARHTEDEAWKLIASMRDRSDRDPAAWGRFVRYVLAFTTGMRDGELAGLRWSSLVTIHGFDAIKVTSAVALIGDEGKATRRAPKTKASARPVPLHTLARDVLEFWGAEGWRRLVGRDPRPEDPILCDEKGQPWRPDSASLFRSDLETAGLPTTYKGEDYEFRSTRRSFTTWLDAHGVDGDTQDRLIRHVEKSIRGKHYRGETRESMARLAAAVATIRLGPTAPGMDQGMDQEGPGEATEEDDDETEAPDMTHLWRSGRVVEGSGFENRRG
jgi:integrase